MAKRDIFGYRYNLDGLVKSIPSRQETTMGNCINHPARETSYKCMKHNIYLCEECLKCRDPELYCKYRPSCPIWFLSRAGDSLDEAKPEDKKQFTVTFLPDNKSVVVDMETTLLDAAGKADIYINSSCNGQGACGKCRLIIESGDVEKNNTPLLTDAEKEKNYVLACQTKILGDIVAKIPEEAIEKKLKIAGMGKEATNRFSGLVKDITPMLVKYPMQLSPPTLDDSISDLDRLKRGLKQGGCDITRLSIGIRVMREIAAAMRNENWRVTASVLQKACSNEVAAIVHGEDGAKSLGLAVDIGTTTIVVYLVDMTDGSILAATSGHNRQAACGDDVINRIVCAEKEGVKKLSRMALATINGLISEAIAGIAGNGRKIDNVVIAGNTIMIHLLLKIEPRYIRREPYIPVAASFPIMKAGNVGIRANPDAGVFIMPGPASYVGGDIVSGVIYSGMYKEPELTLFIDVGTNGEIVLGNRDWLMCASCSAGPAFEGGGIRWGMRAEEGAVEKVSIDKKTLKPALTIIGNQAPRGICGSGMIELISEMMFAGIIDQKGKIRIDKDHPRITSTGDESAYILAFAAETPMDEDLVFSETDIDNIIRSKGAIYAGFTVLLNHMGIDFPAVDRVLIAGGFGRYLDIEKSVMIGLLPDIDREKFSYLGNSSIAGAYMALLSRPVREKAIELCDSMTYLDFSTNPRFMDEFTSAMFLPHTNLSAFPTVMEKIDDLLKDQKEKTLRMNHNV